MGYTDLADLHLLRYFYTEIALAELFNITKILAIVMLQVLVLA